MPESNKILEYFNKYKNKKQKYRDRDKKILYPLFYDKYFYMFFSQINKILLLKYLNNCFLELALNQRQKLEYFIIFQ